MTSKTQESSPVVYKELKKSRQNRKVSLPGRCRGCGHEGLLPVLDLGKMPLTAVLLTEQALGQPENRYPLEAAMCPACSLLQVVETVPPDAIFNQNYPYFSSFSDALLRHSRENVLELIQQRKMTRDHLVVELASNDGYLLKNFVESGIPVLGIDPSGGPAAAARKIGVNTLCAFFTESLARDLVHQGTQADLIIANNVLAHVADTNDFVAGIRRLIKSDGMIVIEVPYVRDLIEKVEFDTIYHEHLCYFSVTSVDKLMRSHGLFLNDMRRLSIHGGSLRLFIEPREAVGPAVRVLLDEEQKLGLPDYSYYRAFSERVIALAKKLRALILDLKRQGKRIAAYGAAAKGMILLNYTGLDHSVIDFVVDRSTFKQGKYLPCVRIPICATEVLTQQQPDYCLILAWNFRDEIIVQQQEFHRKGGRFIIPVPDPQIL